MEYLRCRLFDRIGVSREATCLKCPGGHSWGDSAVLCQAMDLMKVARFVMNHGRWEGEQILNEHYLSLATSRQIDNNIWGSDEFDVRGYGYYFWICRNDSYLFRGMGCQFALCVPDQDLILVYNGDNQGRSEAAKIIIDGFFRLIVDTVQEYPVRERCAGAEPSVSSAAERLRTFCCGLTLASARGRTSSTWEMEINGRTYRLNSNPMGISDIRFTFSDGEGHLFYTNRQGKKELTFGMGHNVFENFPQEGYSDQTGSVTAPNHHYRCAASAAWVEQHKLWIKVQIIDNYLGILNMFFSFQEQKVGVYMAKSAEDFLNEYEGFAGGNSE